MSREALDYVADLLEHDAMIPPGARAVIWPLAKRANRDTAATFTGEWLCKISGLSPGSVRRYVHLFEARGWIRLSHANGRALRVQFPVRGKLTEAAPATGRTDEQGQWHPVYCACPDCRQATG